MFKPRLDYYTGEDLSDLISEKDKSRAPYLIGKADDLIQRLVTGRPELRKRRAFFEGRRNPDDMAHLTEEHGIGNPGKVPFIPLMRNRIQVMKGQYLESGIPHTVGCSDSFSVGTYEQERLEKAVSEIANRLTADLQQRLQAAQQGQQPGAPQLLREEELKRLADDLSEFASSLEIQSQHVTTEILTNPECDTIAKMEQHLENLLVDAATNYVTEEGEPGLLAEHIVVPAGELYTDAPTNALNTKNATAAVRRMLLNKQDVLLRYGQRISDAERRTILGEHRMGGPWTALPLGGEKYLDFFAGGGSKMSTDYREWVAAQDFDHSELVEVFHVQWKACNKVWLVEEDKIPAGARLEATGATAESRALGSGQHLEEGGGMDAEDIDFRYREDLYEVVRIGDNIYCNMGRVAHPIRPTQKPWSCQLNYRGYRLDVSLIEATMDLQNNSDILHYFAQSIVANSGTKGLMFAVNDIPAELGNNVIERLQSAMRWRKMGIVPVNPFQTGGTKGQYSNNQTYDDTLNGQSLSGIKEFLEFYDEMASSITGINRQMLGAMAERDGKAVTEQAVMGATLITKPIFAAFDRLVGDALTDQLNLTRHSFAAASSVTNRLTLGEVGRKLFTIDAKKFPLATYRVYVRDGRQENKQMEGLKGMGLEFVKGQLLPAKAAFDMFFSKSLTEMKRGMLKTLNENEGQKQSQMQQQLEELQKQLEQREKELQGIKQGEAEREAQRVQFEGQKAANDTQRVEIEREKEEKKAENDAARVALERDQAVENSKPQSAEIRNK